MKETEEEVDNMVIFSFDGLDILTAKGSNVWLRALREEEECVLVLSRGDFNRSMKDWLDGKKEYEKRYKEFCGVGQVECSIVKELNNCSLLDYSYHDEEDEDAIKYNEVKTYLCKFDFVQMEHG